MLCQISTFPSQKVTIHRSDNTLYFYRSQRGNLQNAVSYPAFLASVIGPGWQSPYSGFQEVQPVIETLVFSVEVDVECTSWRIRFSEHALTVVIYFYYIRINLLNEALETVQS